MGGEQKLQVLGFTIAVAADRTTCLTSVLRSWDSSVQVFVTARGLVSAHLVEEWCPGLSLG